MIGKLNITTGRRPHNPVQIIQNAEAAEPLRPPPLGFVAAEVKGIPNKAVTSPGQPGQKWQHDKQYPARTSYVHKDLTKPAQTVTPHGDPALLTSPLPLRLTGPAPPNPSA